MAAALQLLLTLAFLPLAVFSISLLGHHDPILMKGLITISPQYPRRAVRSPPCTTLLLTVTPPTHTLTCDTITPPTHTLTCDTIAPLANVLLEDS